jgi:addiction module HigA family antidote
MRKPPHPGAFIRTELLEPYGLTVTAAAKALGVSRVTLSSLLHEHADLSGEMALLLEKAFGLRMETLMRMQASYDIARTRERQRDVSMRAKLLKVRRVRRRGLARKVA